MYVTIMRDPSGRIAGKSYTQTPDAGREVGRNWAAVYRGNTFLTEAEKPAPTQNKRGPRKATQKDATDAAAV